MLREAELLRQHLDRILMKRFLPHILILVIVIVLVGLFSPVLTQAQTGTPTPVVGCSLWRGFSLQGCVMNFMLIVLYGIMSIISLLLMLAGLLLDFIVNFTIVNMRTQLNALTGINIAWKILKDLMNIAFIFMLVYYGITLIIGVSSKESIKKFIVGIILASLLINFSLFFTKILIDASNIVTTGIYHSIIDNTILPVTGPDGVTRPVSGLSVPFMRALGLSSFYSATTFESMRTTAGGDWNALFIPALGVVLFLIVTFVFLSIAILLAVRYFTLVILLILSPIAYMGMALPFMQGYASKWWKALNSQLIFPPVFMIMMLITLTLITSPGFITTGDWAGLTSRTALVNVNASTPGGPISLLFNFGMVIALTIGSLMIAKSTSKEGASQIGNVTSAVTGFAGGLALGGAGRLGRATIGRAANNAVNDEDLKARASMERKGLIDQTKGAWARTVLKTSDKLAGKSFDARGTSSFASLAKTTGFGKDFGTVDKKDNFRDQLKLQAEAAEKNAKLYKPSDATYAAAKEIDSANNKQFDAEIKSAEEKQTQLKEAKQVAVEESVKMNKKVTDLEKEIQNTIIPERKSQLQEELRALKTQNEAKKTEVEQITNSKKEVDRQVEELKKNKKDYVTAESDLNKVYSDRVNALVDLQEQPGRTWRVVANTLGTATNVLGLTAQPRSRVDREVVARKIKGVTKEKSDDEKIAELAKKKIKEEEDKKKADEGGSEPKADAETAAPKPEAEAEAA